MNGGAKAGSSVKADEVTNEAAAWPVFDFSNLSMDQTIEHISAHVQLKGVRWALREGFVSVAGESQVRQDKVQYKEESKGW